MHSPRTSYSSRQPLSARASGNRELYGNRNQFKALKRKYDGFTTDDLWELKREKANLLNEQTILKAKIARYDNMLHHSSAPRRNQQIAKSLEQQVATLEEIVQKRKQDIEDIISSDRAALITELQEESKLLQLEIMRLQETKASTENEYKLVSRQLEIASEKYAPDIIQNQENELKELKRDYKQKKARNNELKKMIDDMKKRREEENEKPENKKLREEIDKIKQQIRAEQKSIAEVEKQMEQMKEKRQNELQQKSSC